MNSILKIGVVLLVIGTIVNLAFNGSFTDTELDKVLAHYENDKNPEKLEAAMFLIDNMEGLYSYKGEAYEQYVGVYNQLKEVPGLYRNDSLNQYMSSLGRLPNLEAELDENTISAEFLIQHIDFAYEVWAKTPWKDDVSFNTFCEYILPYKVDTEGISEYMEVYNQLFAKIFDHIYINGGNIYKAIDQEHKREDVLKIEDADKTSVVQIIRDKTSLVFDSINSYETCSKLLFVWYTNGKKSSDVNIVVNNKDTITVEFKPLNSWYSFPGQPLKVPVQFVKGNNSIEFMSCKDTVGIDFIEVAPYECFYRKDINYKLVDGANYLIRNVQSKKFLDIENGSSENDALLCTSDFNGKNHQRFNIQNMDYGFFKISPTHIKYYKRGLDVANFSKENNATVVMWDFSGHLNQLWAIIPVRKDVYKIMNKLSGKCLELMEETGLVVQNEYSQAATQHWNFERSDNSIYFDLKYHIKQNSPQEATCRVNEILDFEWVLLDAHLPPLPALDILHTKTGNCREESQFVLNILRSVGIPSAVDYNPQRPNASLGHEWNAVINKGNETILFQSGLKPWLGVPELPVAKIYRNNFKLNHNSLSMNKGKDEHIPTLFDNPRMIDVTAEYCPTMQVDVPLFDTDENKNKHAYLAVFNNKKWFPICWSNILNNKCSFRDMGLGVLYLPCYQTNAGDIEAAGFPHIVRQDGSVQKIMPNLVSPQKLVLKRKYPWLVTHHWADFKMDGGIFQGANKADFSDAVTIYTFTGRAEPVFHNVPTNSDSRYKYMRYCGPKGSCSTLSELVFLDHEGKEIAGMPIGSSGSYKDLGHTLELGFDKDILTFFEGVNADESWLGMEFKKPCVVKTIRFMPRNDGNSIEIGDSYELVYWDNHTWKSLGQQKAKSDSLVYDGCPKNAMFLLHNHTKGAEERIFTINDQGEQLWW